MDVEQRGLTLFSEREVAGTVTFATNLPSPSLGVMLPGPLLPDGSTMTAPGLSMDPEARERVDSIPHARADQKEAILDTIFWTRPGEQSTVEVHGALGPGSVQQMFSPFAAGDESTVDPEGLHAVRVRWADECPGDGDPMPVEILGVPSG